MSKPRRVSASGKDEVGMLDVQRDLRVRLNQDKVKKARGVCYQDPPTRLDCRAQKSGGVNRR